MTIEFIKEIQRMIKQDPPYVLRFVIETMVRECGWDGLDKQLQAHLLMALARIEEMRKQDEQD